MFNNWQEQIRREKRAIEQRLDVADRPIKVGDTVAYAISLGRCAGVQIATVDSFTDKGKIRLKINEKYRKDWNEKSVVVVNYPDRMVILKSLTKEKA